MKFYEKIKNLREEHNLTQEAFAKRLDISLNALKNYEDKEIGRIPNSEVLQRISERFNVSTDYLLHDEITNKHYNNIKIGEELSLTDESINILRGIKNTHNINIKAESINLSNTLDLFIKNINLPELMVNIELLQLLSEMYNSIVLPLSTLATNQDFMINCIKSKNNNGLNKIFNEYAFLLNQLTNYINDFYKITPFYHTEKINCDLVNQYFEELKNNVFDGKLSKDYGKTYIEGLSEYQNSIFDIANTLSNDIQLQEYKINKIIMHFVENLQSEESRKWVDIWQYKK